MLFLLWVLRVLFGIDLTITFSTAECPDCVGDLAPFVHFGNVFLLAWCALMVVFGFAMLVRMWK